jgi:hypothetical protein
MKWLAIGLAVAAVIGVVLYALYLYNNAFGKGGSF